MHESPRTRTAPTPGMRALDACGDGFWEFDLLGGSAWFSEWFYRKLNWTSEAKRTLLDLRPVLPPGQWDKLMGQFRLHLEQGAPLDVELNVDLAGQPSPWWHLRGSALRNDAGQPIYLAGSVREVGAPCEAARGRIAGPALRERSVRCAAGGRGAARRTLRRAQGELQMAAASRDPGGTRHGATADGEPPHRVRVVVAARSGGRGWRQPAALAAAPFEHDGSDHLVVTLEDW